MKKLSPPKWAPYAIATEQGWIHPKTGEILISHRGLKSMIEKEQKDIVLEIENSKECVVENTFIKVTTDEKPVENELNNTEEIDETIDKKIKLRRKEKQNY